MFYKLPWSWCLFTSKTVSQPICESWMQKDGAFKVILSYAEGLRAVWAYWELISKGGKRERQSRKQWRSVGDRLVSENTIEASVTTWFWAQSLEPIQRRIQCRLCIISALVLWGGQWRQSRLETHGIGNLEYAVWQKHKEGPCLNKAEGKNWLPHCPLTPKCAPTIHSCLQNGVRLDYIQIFIMKIGGWGDIFVLWNHYSANYYSCMIPRWDALTHARTVLCSTWHTW